MKKIKLIPILFILLLFANTSCYAVADKIMINAATAEIPADMGRIQEADNRTFVPVRFVSEFLKNNVWYDDVTKTVVVDSEKRIIFIQDGNNMLYLIEKETGEKKSITMDTSAFIDSNEGRTYIPIRFLAEALDYTVGWNEATQIVTLDKK